MRIPRPRARRAAGGCLVACGVLGNHTVRAILDNHDVCDRHRFSPRPAAIPLAGATVCRFAKEAMRIQEHCRQVHVHLHVLG